MPGEIWRGTFQIGLETTPGVAVPATRRLYLRTDSNLTREREPRRWHFMTTTRDNVRASTLGPVSAGGTISLPVSSAELVEFLLMTMNGDATATGGLWEFTPGLNLDTTTIQWADGARLWEGTGMRGNTIRFAGSVGAENICTIELFGQDVRVLPALTPALPERLPTFFEGWETAIFIGDIGADPTLPAECPQVLGMLLNWDITFNNNLGRKYFAQNNLEAGAIPVGELEVTAQFTLEAVSTGAIDEYTAWDDNTPRLVSLVFGNNAPDNDFLALDLPGVWQTVDLTGEDEGTRVYQFNYAYQYDPDNGWGVRIRADNSRTTAYTG